MKSEDARISALAYCADEVDALPLERTREWFTAGEAAAYIRSTPGAMAAQRYCGVGPKYFKAGRKVLYDRHDLDAWITGGRE